MKIVFLPHARDQMQEYGISEERARATLSTPDHEYPSYKERFVAEKVFPGDRLAVKVVYNTGVGTERVVVTVMRGRPLHGKEG